MDDSGKGNEWGFTPHPGWDGTLVSNALGQMVGIIGTNQEQYLASWLFLRWLSSPETQAAWVGSTGLFPPALSTSRYVRP